MFSLHKKAKLAIDAANEAMDLYNNGVDKAIPWTKLKEITGKLGESGLLSKENAERIGNIKTQLLNAIDLYDSATQSIYEMAGSMSSILATYIKLLDSPTPAKLAAQKNLLTSMLDNAIKQLTKSEDELTNTVSILNWASDEFKAFLDQLKIDYDENGDFFKNHVNQIVQQKSNNDFWSFFRKKEIEQEAIAELRGKLKPIQEFYEDASKTVQQAQLNLGQVTLQLNKNLQTIGQRKIQVNTMSVDDTSQLRDASKIRDTITQSAQALIAKCQEYLQRHA